MESIVVMVNMEVVEDLMEVRIWDVVQNAVDGTMPTTLPVQSSRL